MFPDLSAVEAYLNSLVNYESRMPLGGRDWPKLEPTRDAVKRLGLSFSLSNCVHIAGTKGKGSVATFLEALLSPDYPTLSFTSPHLISFTERVRSNGLAVDEGVWCQGFTDIVSRLESPPAIKLTYFETTFLFYLWAARHLKAQVHVVEAGLGGRWDATNVLQDTIPVLTLVDYDHTDILGKTLTEIAGDKAGIIKPHSRVVVGRQPAEAFSVFEKIMADNHATPLIFDKDFWWSGDVGHSFSYHEPSVSFPDLTLDTPGLHQRDNACVAIRAARLVQPQMMSTRVRARLQDCVVPGRQQLLPGNPPVMVDVAHNPVSFAALSKTLVEEYGSPDILAVVGLMRDKDARACFAHLKGLIARMLVVPVGSPRSYPATDLAATLRDMGFDAVPVESREAAFSVLHQPYRQHFGLVTGSFYLVGDYLMWRQRAGIA